MSTTMVFVRMLAKMLRDQEIGKLVVPIVPDEARTFGMEALFRQVGIYSHIGQLYEPVDIDTLLYYKEAQNGQILEEGINEAGSMSSFIAAGTAYATHGVNTIPFFIYYSMFGFQRIGDLIWAAADMRAKGFLLGGTAGRTTLAGEGLQHQDGHSHVAGADGADLPRLRPGLRLRARGHRRGRPEADVSRRRGLLLLPDGDERAVRDAADARGRAATASCGALQAEGVRDEEGSKLQAQLLGSGAILGEVLKAQQILGEKYGVAADVWSVTSYNELYRDGLAAERWNMLHPASEQQGAVRDRRCSASAAGRLRRRVRLHEGAARRRSIAGCRGRCTCSAPTASAAARAAPSLRDFFEVDARFIVLATLTALARGEEDRRQGGAAGDEGPRHQPGEEEPGVRCGVP